MNSCDITIQVLNEYFHNVCELDLVFNFYKVSLAYLEKRKDNGAFFAGLQHCGRDVLSWRNQRDQPDQSPEAASHVKQSGVIYPSSDFCYQYQYL